MYYVIFCTFVSIFIVWWLKRLIEARLSPLIKIPGRQLYNPIFGTIPVFQTCPFHERWRKHYEIYGTVYRIYVFNGVPWIVVTDPKTVRYILSTNSKNYVRGPLGSAEAFEWIVGKSSLLLLDGEIHKTHRSLVSPAFRQSHLKKLVPLMNDCSRRLINHWMELIATGQTIVDAKKYMSKVTLNIIGLAAFGFDFDCVGKESEIADGIQKIVGAQDLLDHVVINLLSSYFPFLSRLLSAKIAHLVKGINITRGALKHMVNTKLNTVDQWKDNETSFLELVVGSTVADKGACLNEEELEDEMMTFILAGHETSSLALTYVLYTLCKFPSWQEKCREEVKKMVKPSLELTWDDIQHLKYVKCVIYEALRLYPPAPLVLRQSVDEDFLKGHRIPAKTNVSILIGQMHRIPEFWPDPEDFKPERFLDVDPHLSVFDAYMPFGDGVHKCIGYQFALTEVALVLSMLLKEFRFELVSPKDTLTFSMGITMGPKRPIMLKVMKL